MSSEPADRLRSTIRVSFTMRNGPHLLMGHSSFTDSGGQQ